MKTKITTTPEGEKLIVDFLTEMLGTKEEAPVYSLGFQRWMKLSKNKKLALEVKFNFDTQKAINSLND